MKQTESNPLRRELARGQYGEPHPDSDLLTALAEGSLLQRERQQVLSHLAVCSACREILGTAAAAALDSADDIEPLVLTCTSPTPRRSMLPWTSIAAGLIVVCSAMLFYQHKLALPKNTFVATNETVQLPSPTRQQSPQLPPSAQKETMPKVADRSRQQQFGEPLQSHGTIAGDSIQKDQSESSKESELSQLKPQQIGTEAVEVATASVAAKKAAPAPSAPAFMNTVTERALSAASVTSAARPHWRINSLGQAERSFGEGAWQAVLPREPSKMRVVSVFNGEVWIGGDNSRLYHSTDNGATWILVTLPDKDGREHSVAHIHFQNAQSGSVEAKDGTIWTTSNGGNTWK